MPTDQQPSYPLDSVGWLTVQWLDPRSGDPSAVGFRDLLVNAHRIAGLLVGPAPAQSALYRILYALTARVTGLDALPDDHDEWFDRREEVAEAGISETAVDAYLRPLRARFDLFGPTPFLQDPRLRDQCPKTAGLNKLVLGRSAGNNHAWFGHHHDATPHPVASPEALLHLLTWLYYGPSGRCSSRSVRGTTAAQVYAGPLRSSLSYHPEGKSLLHTLLAGLTPPKPSDRREHDPCPWEADPEPDPLRVTGTYRGPCSRLTGGWQHALLLLPNADGQQVTDAYITWSGRHPMPPTDDAYVIWQLSKAGNLYARRADSGRALWRDVDSLLLEKSSGSNQARRPAVFGTAVDGIPDVRVRALGFEQDGKTQDVQFVSATTPSLLDLLKARKKETARRVGDTRQIAERYGDRLDRAVKQAWAEIATGKIGDCAWSEEAKARYWPAAEDDFWDIVHNEAFDRAPKTFYKLASQAFEDVTHDAVRTCRDTAAVEKARLQLHGGRRRPAASRPAGDPQLTAQGNTMTSSPSPAPDADSPEYTFVTRVHSLCSTGGARAALRSGLRRPVDQCVRMHALIAEEIPEEDQGREGAERAYYAVAAMIASLPPSARRGRDASAEEEQENAGAAEEATTSATERPRRRRDFGICLAEAVARAPHRERAVEDRLDLLAKQSAEGIHRHLPGVVAFIADRPDAVNWPSLLRDLRSWERNRARITRRWMQSYYRERNRAAQSAAAEADFEQHGDSDQS